MIYLYLKTHNKTGLKYLGMTSQDPYKYLGSGLHWKRHLKVNGNDVSTIILKECVDHKEVSYWGNYYSEILDVVNSAEYANLVPELGENSCGMYGKLHTMETKLKISNSLNGHVVLEETKNKIKTSLLGNVPWNKNKSGEYHIFTKEQLVERSIMFSGENNPFYGKTHSDEFKYKQTQNQKKSIKCPHCNKEGAVRIMKRWHFDRCVNKLT